MDGSLLKEIHYLTRLIEQHKRKAPEKLPRTDKICTNQDYNLQKSEKRTKLIHRSQLPLNSVCEDSYNSTTVKRQLTGMNVHVNPNFKPQNPVIHINPKVRMKPLVHVNPQMIKHVDSSTKSSELKSANLPTNVNQNVVQTDVKRSVYVNPKLMKKLSSTSTSKPVECRQTVAQEATHSVCSRLKYVKSTNSPKPIPKKTNNSSVVILSQRKLIRVRRGSRGSTTISQTGLSKIKKPLISPFKKIKATSSKLIKAKISDGVQQSTSQNYNFVKLSINKPKINKYRIDRTGAETPKTKKRVVSSPKKVINKKMELITIGGIVYKSSKNRLVRRSYGSKKKQLTNLKTDKFIIAKNGNKLCRLKSAKEILAGSDTSTSGTKLLFNIVQKTNNKNNISNKVKQRSIQILRNKMRKNNQPCLIYQRFGYCANHEKGTCPKLHDKKQISLCKKFLQGNCLLDKCPLSHDIGPEKMPTCKYFLEGCCTRDACPYRHIKVSSNTPICIEFLKGYCIKGRECKRRHEYLCPEFDKTEKCSKGKYCPYPHKSHSSTVKQTDKYLKRKHNVPGSQATSTTDNTSSSSNHESRLRYYEQGGTLNEDLDKKKESIMKKIKLMKSVQVAIHSDNAGLIENDKASSSDTTHDDSELEIISETKTLKRPPIGSLPAYIPFD